jgi:hypothetical protein
VDGNQFDQIAQTLRHGSTRRAAMGLLAGGGLAGVAGRLGLATVAEAKHKRRKRKRGDRCYGSHPTRCSPSASHPNQYCFPRGAVCCGPSLGGGACPPGEGCCPPSQAHPEGNCAGVDEVCCSVEAGGGSCPTSHPVCCGPTAGAPAGSCIPSGFKCCPYGGLCYEDETCCAPSPAFPQGVCAPHGAFCPRAGVAESDDRLAPIRRAEALPRLERGRLAMDGDDHSGRRK